MISAVDRPEVDVSGVLVHVDRCIETYGARCRARIPAFVERHFSFDQSWELQRRTLWLDIALAPINSAWAIPYLSIKKFCGMLDSLGAPAAGRIVQSVPTGIKPGYQRAIERIITSQLLEWDFESDAVGIPQGVLAELAKHPTLKGLAKGRDADARRSLRTIVETFSAGRTLVSSLAGTALTLALGWLTLGNTSLTLEGIANGIARRNARNRAVSRFFLGRGAGSVFYRVFPPAPNKTEMTIMLLVLGFAVTVGAIACTVVSDPLRKATGLHRRRLTTLVDAIERELALIARKHVKHALGSGALSPVGAGPSSQTDE
jgi:hypothetical protein